MKIVIFNLFLIINNLAALDYKYHSYNDITNLLKKYASDFPSKTYLYSIGKSIQGN